MMINETTEAVVMPGFSITRLEAIRHHTDLAERLEKDGDLVGAYMAMYNAQLIDLYLPIDNASK